MKVKTDYSQCPYITAGKLYSIELDSDRDHTIVDDVGERIWIIVDEKGCPHLKYDRWQIVEEKPFDITQHEWSDITMHGYEAAKCANGSIILNGSSKSKVINKKDGIAIAKALGVTAEDLK